MTPAFPEPRARLTDPSTSHEAAVDASKRSPRHRVLAARTLAAHPEGLTDFQLAEKTGLQQTSIGKRRGELMAAGLVEDAGTKRSAPSGSMATVWRLTEAGRAFVTETQEIPASPSLRLVKRPGTEERAEEQSKAPEGRSGSRRPRSIHPAQFPKYLVPHLADALMRNAGGLKRFALDPFAGLGHRFASVCALAGFSGVGVEIEPGYFEAGATHPCVRLGDSTQLVEMFGRKRFGAVVTSPSYPGGMNDDFVARDNSARNTYVHRLREHLGADYQLALNSTARHGIRKGSKSLARYCELHEAVLDQCAEVLEDGGIFILNAKDVLAKGEIAFATASWFVSQLERRGFEVVEWNLIEATGLKQGSNREVRRDFEDLVTLKKEAN